MNFRIIRPETAFTDAKLTPRAIDKSYTAFIHKLPCIIKKTSPVVSAHLSKTDMSFLHLGRAKTSKADDRWQLPLCDELHKEQDSIGEMPMWEKYGIDPHKACVSIYSFYCAIQDEDAAVTVVTSAIMNNQWSTA